MVIICLSPITKDHALIKIKIYLHNPSKYANFASRMNDSPFFIMTTPTHPCHISIVSPVYRGEKMVAELVARIMHTMDELFSDIAESSANTPPRLREAYSPTKSFLSMMLRPTAHGRK